MADKIEPIVQIKPVESYEVSVRGKSLGVFKVKSKWNGLIELENSAIVFPDSPLLIDGAFGGQTNAYVIKATPDICAAIKECVEETTT